MGTEARALPVSWGPVEVARGNQWLNKQTVDGFVWGVFQGEGGEVDLLVPELEQAVIGAQRVNRLGIQGDAGLPGPLRQPLVEFPWRHG